LPSISSTRGPTRHTLQQRLPKLRSAIFNVNVLKEEIDLGPITMIFQGDLKNAEKLFRQALEKDAMNVKALSGLAQILKDDDPERKQFLERILGVRDDLMALLSLGDYCRTFEKDFDRAHALYKRAAEQYPGDKPAYLKLQDICRRTGRTEEAKEWSDRWKARQQAERAPRSQRDKPREAIVDAEGWTTCPACGFRFEVSNDRVLRDGRHRRCGQLLDLKPNPQSSR
jgi:tetratricopeptide (TPR) repeat protein